MFFVIFNEVELSQFQKFGIYVLVTVVLVIFAGLRGPIEGDYLAYQDIFMLSAQPFRLELGIEPLYFYFNKVVNVLGWPFQIIVFSMAIAAILPKFYFFYKNSLNFSFSVFIYYCTCFFVFDFIQIRQAVVIGIFMLSLHFIYEKKLWKYLLTILFAAQIHISAIILMPGYFVFNKVFPKYLLYGILGICTVLNLLQVTVPLINMILKVIPVSGFSEAKMAVYTQSTEFSGVSIKQLLFGFIFVFIRDKEFKNDRYLNILVNLFVAGVLLTTSLNGISELAFRIKWYFFWTESLLMIYVVQYLSFNRLSIKYLLYGLLIVLYVFSLTSMLNEFANRGPYIFPYKTIFEF